MLRGDEQRGDFRHPRRIDAAAPVRVRRRTDVDVGLLVERVHRERQEHRALRRLHRHLERAAERARDVVRVMDLRRPLADGPRHVDERAGQMRLLEQRAARRLARVHDQRRLADRGVVHHAERVAEPGRDVDLDERRSARDARVRVRHADRDAFVQGEHELDLRIILQHVHEPLLGRAGVPEDVPDPVGDQLLEQRALAGHAWHIRLLWGASKCPPSPLTLGRAPAKPGLSSMTRAIRLPIASNPEGIMSPWRPWRPRRTTGQRSSTS